MITADNWAVAQTISSITYTALTLIIAVFSIMATRIASQQAKETMKSNAESLRLAKSAADAALLNARAAVTAQRPWLELLLSPDSALTLGEDPSLKVAIELHNTGNSPASRAISITHAFVQSHGVVSQVIDAKAQMVKDTLLLNMKAHGAGMTVFSKMPATSHSTVILDASNLADINRDAGFPFYIIAGVGYVFNDEMHTTINAYLLIDETSQDEVNSILLSRGEIPQEKLKLRKLALGTFVD